MRHSSVEVNGCLQNKLVNWFLSSYLRKETSMQKVCRAMNTTRRPYSTKFQNLDFELSGYNQVDLINQIITSYFYDAQSVTIERNYSTDKLSHIKYLLSKI